MYMVFFNEKCLEECENLDTTINFLYKSLNCLREHDIKVYTELTEVENWINIWKKDFDPSSKYLSLLLIKEFEKIPINQEQFYYYYFSHQDYKLQIGENISTSSIATATEFMLNKYTTALLSLSYSKYSKRPFLPVIKSPHNNLKEDSLINIPNFSDAGLLVHFIFLKTKVISIYSGANFEEFSNSCITHFKNFNKDLWKPNTSLDTGHLSPVCLFPITENALILKEIKNWSIKKESVENNITKYKELAVIILTLNYYRKNTALSAHYNRIIFEGGTGNSKLLISVDIENGGLEVIDHTGTHIGAYNYIGIRKKVYTSSAELTSHSLPKLQKSMFLFG